NDRHGHTQGNGGYRPKLCRELFRQGAVDHCAVSGGAESAARELSELSVSHLRRRRSAGWVALRSVQDLRERMSAAMHLYRQERRQKARLHGQTAVLSGGVRHRHLSLHELPDLRGGLSV